MSDILALADKIDAVYERVKCFPENQPDSGYLDLLMLRNLAHEASATLRSQGESDRCPICSKLRAFCICRKGQGGQADVRQDGLDKVRETMKRLKDTECRHSGQMSETLLYQLHSRVATFLASQAPSEARMDHRTSEPASAVIGHQKAEDDAS